MHTTEAVVIYSIQKIDMDERKLLKKEKNKKEKYVKGMKKLKAILKNVTVQMPKQ